MFVNRYGIFKRIPSKFYVPIKLNMLSHFQVPDSAHFSLRDMKLSMQWIVKKTRLSGTIYLDFYAFYCFFSAVPFSFEKNSLFAHKHTWKGMHFSPTILKFPNKSEQSFRSNILPHKTSSTIKLINKYIPSCNVFPAFLFDHAWFKLKGCHDMSHTNEVTYYLFNKYYCFWKIFNSV